jgi:hypothetical protein
MISYPAAPEVVDQCGDKVIGAVRQAVLEAAVDLSTYRGWRPVWVAAHSDRGLANWIHDRIWDHVVVSLSENPEVMLRDEGVTREFMVAGRFRIRIKRHTADGIIRNYPTQTALDFEVQPRNMLPGLEETRLYCGYVWHREERLMGDAVISLHDGQDEVVWISQLLDPRQGQGTVRQIWPTGSGGPERPVITMPRLDEEGKGTGSDE